MDNKLNLVVQFSALDKLSGGLRNIIGLGRSGDQALRAMKREARDLGQQLKQAQQATAGATGNVSALIAKERQLEAAIAGVNTQMQRQLKLNAIDGKVGRMQARGDQLKSSGTDNMIGGATLLTPFVLAGAAAMDFSSGMVDIQQKANLTNRETAQMARNILNAAQHAHRLPEELRAGVDVLAGFGLDPRQAVQMIGPLGRLGTAFKVDLADGAAAAFANLNNLKVPLAQTTQALDMMAAGGNAGAFEIRDMARHFPGLTAQMQGLGQSGLGAVGDLTAALQIARRTAGTSDEAATNVQNLLAKINSPGVIRAFQKNFGVDLPAALKQAYAQGKTPMEALAEITSKATGGDLSKLGFALEDMQAQSALRALILNMDDYRKIRESIGKGSGGTVDKAFSQRELQDASVAWQSFKGSVSALAITLGTTVLPVVTQFFGYLNSGIGVISRWAQANPEAASTLITLVAGFAAARVGLGALQFAFGSILGPAAQAWGVWSKYRAMGSIAAAFPKVARAFGILRTAALFLGQGMMRAGMMMLANPIVLVVVAIGLAIAGVAYLIYSNWDWIKSTFWAGVNWVKNTLNGLPTWLRSIGSTMMAGLMAALNPAGLAYLVYANWDRIKAAFWAGVNLVKSSLVGLPGWMGSIGRMMMAGLLNSINPAGLALRLISMAKNGIAAFKNYLGIKSPSRLMMEMGGHVTTGLAMGLDRGGKQPLRSMGRLAAGLAGAGSLALAPPAMAGGPGGSSAGQGSGSKIEIHIHQQPGEDADALADRVMRRLEAAQTVKRRSSFADDF